MAEKMKVWILRPVTRGFRTTQNRNPRRSRAWNRWAKRTAYHRERTSLRVAVHSSNWECVMHPTCNTRPMSEMDAH